MKAVRKALLPHQYEFVSDTESKFLGLSGGYGSGKSECGFQRTILLMIQDPTINTLYAMPSFDLLNLRAVGGFSEILHEYGISFTYTKQSKIFSLSGMGNIYLRSYDNPDSMISFEVAHMTLDELDVLNHDKAQDVWNKAVSRIRQHTTHPAGNTISLVSTPDGGLNGFFYKRFVENPAPGTRLIKASTTANFFLPSDYVDMLKDTYADNELVSMYLEGEFVSLSKVRQFTRYNVVTNATDELAEPDDMKHIGMDFNNQGSVMVVATKIDGILRVVAEHVAKDTMAMIALLKRTYEMDKMILYPDSSSQNNTTNADRSSLVLLKDAGFVVKHSKKHPQVASSLMQCNNHLFTKKILVNARSCPRLTQTLELIGYDKNDKAEKFSSHKDGSMDDYGDAFRYLVNGTLPLLTRVRVGRISKFN